MLKIGSRVLRSGPAPLTIRLLVLAELARGEPEARVVRRLCDGRTFVDVGANRGVYSYLARATSSEVWAFEPNDDLAEYVEAWSRGAVHVEAVALSDSSGRADLTTPVRDGTEQDGLSTLRPIDTETLADARVRSVRTAALDEFDLGPVGVIKVDVEGHELEVLQGAVEILGRDQPLIQVECEERHRPRGVAQVTELLGAHGYRGYFSAGRWPEPVESFDAATHQCLEDLGDHARYANNFYFCATDEQYRRVDDAMTRSRRILRRRHG